MEKNSVLPKHQCFWFSHTQSSQKPRDLVSSPDGNTWELDSSTCLEFENDSKKHTD